MKLSATARHIHYSRQSGVTPFQLIVGLLVLVGLGVGGWCLMQFSGGGDKGGKKVVDKTYYVAFTDDLKDIQRLWKLPLLTRNFLKRKIEALNTMAGGLSDYLTEITPDKKAVLIKIALEYAPKILPLLDKATAIFQSL